LPDIALSVFTMKAHNETTPLELVMTHELENRREAESNWIKATGFEAKSGTICPLSGENGAPSKILVGVGDRLPQPDDIWWLSEVYEKLPKNRYEIINAPSDAILRSGAIGWALAAYKFDRYLSDKNEKISKLALPKAIDLDGVIREATSVALVRDLVNTPTDDLGPAELQDAAEALAEEFGASCSTIVGDDLLDENFPAIHAVGRAAALGREPRLIDLIWGEDTAPRVTLVGKGVCFDTGGLDIKTGGSMRLMKKDMGGAANALGLARLIMTAGLKVRLRLLIPAVENAIAGNSYRPGDVVATRKGFSVEIGNTDAEGRVVLCDALALACEETPDYLFDFATLTGAARVALGPDLPATFSNDDTLWTALETAAKHVGDPLWRLPLWAPYDEGLASPIADICNIGDSPMGGSITAALYLQRFVDEGIKWVHVDLYAWNPKARPGRPKGGEAQAIRAVYAALSSLV